jgi:signal transduction histidine kinase
LNHLLGVIVSASSALRMHLPPEGRATELATEIQSAAERAAALVRRTLIAARREREHAQLDVSAVVRGMEPLLRCVAGDRVSLTVECDAAAGVVVVDRERLENVILNLVANARDATPHGGNVTVSTTSIPPREEEGPSYATITVADTGVGMTLEVRERLFEPFFTTKPVGHGTGLGLPSAQRFASESGGAIAVHSELNQGTAVVLYLPRVA